jgi:hypothetical protein
MEEVKVMEINVGDYLQFEDAEDCFVVFVTKVKSDTFKAIVIHVSNGETYTIGTKSSDWNYIEWAKNWTKVTPKFKKQ